MRVFLEEWNVFECVENILSRSWFGVGNIQRGFNKTASAVTLCRPATTFGCLVLCVHCNSTGPGLVLVIYSEAFTKLPVPQLWAVLFFVMLCSLSRPGVGNIPGGVDQAAPATTLGCPVLCYDSRPWYRQSGRNFTLQNFKIT
ncbi:hypothetical protein MAR_025556 [Mya arenaria]|uniref:Uncharacterized protein n=1 Tax=Mya arenaria TaxID=6604 RepID=A0ABY7ERM5_MYAAR|nr:hypothetical protein MAR_025556 [Mya arenaria]